MKQNHLNRVILGTAQFGSKYGVLNQNGQVTVNQVRLILAEASQLGIEALDTAAVYGNCEVILGQIGIKDFNVITKILPFNTNKTDGEAWVDNCIDEALSRLKVDNIYGVLMHKSSDLLNRRGFKVYKKLEALKSKGIITKIGVSIYDPKELDDLLAVGVHFDLVQAPFNVFDRRLYSSSWLTRLKDLGVEVHVRSIFLQGILLASRENRPFYFSRWSEHFRIWDKWIFENNITAIQACVDFVCSFDMIDKFVIGVDGLAQFKALTQLFSSSGNMVTPTELMNNDKNLIDPRSWGTR
jgi:aryl-alcohol dehydrogenase-like predicted oxidoreductase